MPVLDNAPHEITKRTEAEPYGCKDKVFYSHYPVKVREYSDDGLSYELVNTLIEHRMSKECRYSASLTDPRCATCRHRGSGERYDKKIREQGN